MRKVTAISLAIAMVALFIFATWLAKLMWFKPFNINHFFERAYIEFLWDDPEALTETGILHGYLFSDYENELTMISPTNTRRLANIGRDNLNMLEEYDRSKLKDDQRLSYDIMHWFLQTGVDAEPYLFHDYPVTHLSGAHLELPQFFNSLPLESKHQIESYLARLGKVDDKFGSVIDGLEERRKLGIIPPTHILQKSISFCDKFYQTPWQENVFYAQFKKKLDALNFIDPNSREMYLTECATIIQEEVIPAYQRLSRFLFQLERKSFAIAGVWHLPNGAEYYRSCLKQQTTTEFEPDSLYELGKSEMTRLKTELTVLLSLIGRYRGNVSQSLAELNNDQKLTFRTDSIGRIETIEYFKDANLQITSLCADYFNHLPTLALDVIELPEYRSENSTFAFYLPPREEPPRNGRLYINTWKAKHLTKPLASIYAYHEGIPGHHLQKSVQAELNDLPTFRRFIPFDAYSEGWAMYAEQLGLEIDGSDDPMDHIALLQSDLFRTARMMTDIGIHHKMWLREQAIEFMVENSALSNLEAEVEVDRYIVWPGQGCAYKVGQLKFLELRQKVENELGDQFDIKEFHDVLIEKGAMPLEVLEQQVNEYLKSKKVD